MIRVVFLGMGGPITTMVLNTLLSHKNVELMCLIKPLQKGNSDSKAKQIFQKLPPLIQRAIRSCRIKFLNIEKWQLPDLISRFNIDVITTGDINSGKTIELIQSKKPDLIVVANFNQILKKGILSIPKIGCINVHPSLLPDYRGANPIFWMFKNNEQTGGTTIHLIDEGIDTGGIIKQSEFRLSESESVQSYSIKCGHAAAKDLNSVLDSLSENTSLSSVNIVKKGKYYPRPTEKDGELLLIDKPEIVLRNYRVMKNYTPVYLSIDNKQFTITSAWIDKTNESGNEPNEFVYSSNEKALKFKGTYNA
ncbi:methionyl-tRNA formyltransferase [Carboxylicivirga sp. RSCT41]|uniref:methionyl-tRNA formyltransferase n=1 Tax=Carboxylicivirga agarovorans TaxID=3417570 RepID=UPI003D350DF4